MTAKFALNHAERMAAETGDSLKVMAFKGKRLDTALSRFGATMKLLAQVRAAHPEGLLPSSNEPRTPRVYKPGRESSAG